MTTLMPTLMDLPEEQLRAIFRGLITMGCCANKRLAEMLRVVGGPEAPFRFQIFEDITTAELTRVLKRFPNAVIGMRAKRAIMPNEARVVEVWGAGRAGTAASERSVTAHERWPRHERDGGYRTPRRAHGSV